MRYDTTAELHGSVRPPPGAAAAVIELGAYRGADPGDGVDRPAPRRRSTPLAVAMMLVLLTVSAAAGPQSAPLRQSWRVDASATDTFSVFGDVLLVARRTTERGLWGYAVDTGRPRWRTDVTPATSYAVRRSGDTLFVGERTSGGAGGQPGAVATGQLRTTAVSGDSGTTLWGHAGRVIPVDGASTVLAVSDVPSVFGGGRRVHGQVIGMEVGTGRRLWSVPVPSTAVLQPLPGPPARMLLVHDTGRMRLHDLTDGRVLATAALPPANYAPDNPSVVGGAVLLRHPRAGGWALSAYDPGSLAQRWSRSESTVPDAVRPCGSLICLTGRSGVQGLDPADGSGRWSRPGWRTLEQRGEHSLVYDTRAGAAELTGLADPYTGALLVDLRRWRAVPGPADADVLLSRAPDADGRTVLALADPGRRVVRLLGTLAKGTGDCRAGRGRVVCRSGDGAVVAWTYR